MGGGVLLCVDAGAFFVCVVGIGGCVVEWEAQIVFPGAGRLYDVYGCQIYL